MFAASRLPLLLFALLYEFYEREHVLIKRLTIHLLNYNKSNIYEESRYLTYHYYGSFCGRTHTSLP